MSTKLQRTSADRPHEARRERSGMIAGAALAAGAVLVLVACGTGPSDGDAAADTTPDGAAAPRADTPRDDAARTDSTDPAGACAAELEFRGTTYVLDGTERVIDGKARTPVGRATVPACDDTPGAGDVDGDMARTVAVQQFPGTPLDEKVVSGGQVWVAYR